MNGRYQFGWIIKILSKDEQGFQIELADLGNGKHMVVATDLSNPISENVYRQAGFGPFILDPDMVLDNIFTDLKEDLLKRRGNMDECDCNFPSCMECFERHFKAVEEYCGVDKAMCYEGLDIIAAEFVEELTLENCDPKVLEEIIKNPNEW